MAFIARFNLGHASAEMLIQGLSYIKTNSKLHVLGLYLGCRKLPNPVECPKFLQAADPRPLQGGRQP